MQILAMMLNCENFKILRVMFNDTALKIQMEIFLLSPINFKRCNYMCFMSMNYLYARYLCSRDALAIKAEQA